VLELLLWKGEETVMVLAGGIRVHYRNMYDTKLGILV